MKPLKVIGLLVLVFIFIAASNIFYLTRGLEEGLSVEVGQVVMTNLNDGIYKGKYEHGRWNNEVNVMVKDNKIIKIDLVKDVKFPQDNLSNEIFDRVIEKQNTTVDVVSQATVTSKAYLKSIENALTNK